LKIRKIALVGLVLGLVCYWLGSSGMPKFFSSSDPEPPAKISDPSKISYYPRSRFDDSSGFAIVVLRFQFTKVRDPLLAWISTEHSSPKFWDR